VKVPKIDWQAIGRLAEKLAPGDIGVLVLIAIIMAYALWANATWYPDPSVHGFGRP
jgi:hypothetical protein